MVLGSPGGGRIITTVANIFLSVADEGLNIEQAVDAPRFHHQYLPDVLYLEPGFSRETVEGLRAEGYTLRAAAIGATASASPSIPTAARRRPGSPHHYGKAAGY